MSNFEPDGYELVGTGTAWGTDADVNENVTGAITAFTNPGGGQVTVESAGHGLNEDQWVRIVGTIYDGDHVATNVSTDDFEITAVWSATDTGDWLANFISDAYIEFYPTTPAANPVYRTKKLIPAEAGSPYRIRAILQADSASTCRVGVDWFTSDETFISTTKILDGALPSVNTWHDVSGVVEAPQNTAFAKPRAEKNNTAFTMYLDHLALLRMPVACDAYQGGTQGVATGLAVVQFPTENYDYGGNYDNATYRYNIQSAGIYSVKVIAFVETATADVNMNFHFRIRVNGATNYIVQSENDVTAMFAPSPWWSVSADMDLLLSAGDYFEITVTHTNTANLNIGGVNNTRLMVAKVE